MFDGSKWQQARVAHCMCSIYLTWKTSQESIPGKGGWLGYNPDKAVMEGQLHGFCAECVFVVQSSLPIKSASFMKDMKLFRHWDHQGLSSTSRLRSIVFKAGPSTEMGDAGRRTLKAGKGFKDSKPTSLMHLANNFSRHLLIGLCPFYLR